MAEPVVSVGARPGFDFGPEGGSERFGATLTQIGEALGLKELGLNLTEVPPGKRASPFHNHLAKDEVFIILDGDGLCRGGADMAHRLINTGPMPPRYSAISTRNGPEIVEYPASGKYSAPAIWPGQNLFNAYFRHVGRKDDALAYWDGEDT